MRKLLGGVLSAILIAVMLFASLVSCGNGGDSLTDSVNAGESASDKPNEAINPIDVKEEHFWYGGLHKVNVTENPQRVLVENGVSDYTIVYDVESSKALQAANFILKHISAATGADVKITAGEDIVAVSGNDKYIVLGRRDLFSAAGLTMPEDDLAPSGYYLKTYGNSVFMEVATGFGYQQGAITLLKHVLGYTMYSEDTVVYTKTGKTIPDMEIIEKPDYGYRVQGNAVSDEARYGMGFIKNQDIIIPVGQGGYFHNSLNYFDSSENKIDPTLAEEHPKWFATNNRELCYTARGDEEELELMITRVAEIIEQKAEEYPETPVITFTIQDNFYSCECTWCKKFEETYGNAAAAARVIQFTNRVAKKVDAYFEEKAAAENAEKRDLLINIFAYHHTTQAPVVKNADGSYSAMDESVVLEKNVGVFIAPIEASFTHSFYDDVNKQYAEIAEGWASLSSHVYAWLYEPNYSYYLYPFNTFDSSLETLRFFRANNSEYVWTEGQTMQTNATGFNKLKEYINSVEEFDVNCNLQEITDDFFANYFLEAAKPMRQFLSEFQIWSRKIENDETNEISGTIYEQIAVSKYWPRNLLTHWLDLIDEAYEAIEPLKYTDNAKYRIIAKHIKIESIFPRYALLTLHSGYYSQESLKAERIAFRDDCRELSIQYTAQNVGLDILYATWGI